MKNEQLELMPQKYQAPIMAAIIVALVTYLLNPFGLGLHYDAAIYIKMAYTALDESFFEVSELNNWFPAGYPWLISLGMGLLGEKPIFVATLITCLSLGTITWTLLREIFSYKENWLWYEILLISFLISALVLKISFHSFIAVAIHSEPAFIAAIFLALHFLSFWRRFQIPHYFGLAFLCFVLAWSFRHVGIITFPILLVSLGMVIIGSSIKTSFSLLLKGKVSIAIASSAFILFCSYNKLQFGYFFKTSHTNEILSLSLKGSIETINEFIVRSIDILFLFPSTYKYYSVLHNQRISELVDKVEIAWLIFVVIFAIIFLLFLISFITFIKNRSYFLKKNTFPIEYFVWLVVYSLAVGYYVTTAKSTITQIRGFEFRYIVPILFSITIILSIFLTGVYKNKLLSLWLNKILLLFLCLITSISLGLTIDRHIEHTFNFNMESAHFKTANVRNHWQFKKLRTRVNSSEKVIGVLFESRKTNNTQEVRNFSMLTVLLQLKEMAVLNAENSPILRVTDINDVTKKALLIAQSKRETLEQFLKNKFEIGNCEKLLGFTVCDAHKLQ